MIFGRDTLSVLNKEMVRVATVYYEEDWCIKEIKHCNSAQPDYHSETNHGMTWLMAFETKPMPKCVNQYKGSTKDHWNSCYMRVQVGSDGTIKPVDIKSESLCF